MSDLDTIMLTGERRQYVKDKLPQILGNRFRTLLTMIDNVTTYNDLLEAAEYAKGFSRGLKECHDNWRPPINGP